MVPPWKGWYVLIFRQRIQVIHRGMQWPYSYDSCDIGTLPNQTYVDGTGPVAALSDGDQYNEGRLVRGIFSPLPEVILVSYLTIRQSFLPGQRLCKYPQLSGGSELDRAIQRRAPALVNLIPALCARTAHT